MTKINVIGYFDYILASSYVKLKASHFFTLSVYTTENMDPLAI